jgi:hypothetical protein
MLSAYKENQLYGYLDNEVRWTFENQTSADHLNLSVQAVIDDIVPVWVESGWNDMEIEDGKNLIRLYAKPYLDLFDLPPITRDLPGHGVQPASKAGIFGALAGIATLGIMVVVDHYR